MLHRSMVPLASLSSSGYACRINSRVSEALLLKHQQNLIVQHCLSYQAWAGFKSKILHNILNPPTI